MKAISHRISHLKKFAKYYLVASSDLLKEREKMKSNAVIFFALVLSVFILITFAVAKEDTISREEKRVDFEPEALDSSSCKVEGKGELKTHSMISLSQVHGLGFLQFLAVYRFLYFFFFFLLSAFLFDFSSALLLYHLVIMILYYQT